MHIRRGVQPESGRRSIVGAWRGGVHVCIRCDRESQAGRRGRSGHADRGRLGRMVAGCVECIHRVAVGGGWRYRRIRIREGAAQNSSQAGAVPINGITRYPDIIGRSQPAQVHPRAADSRSGHRSSGRWAPGYPPKNRASAVPHSRLIRALGSSRQPSWLW